MYQNLKKKFQNIFFTLLSCSLNTLNAYFELNRNFFSFCFFIDATSFFKKTTWLKKLLDHYTVNNYSFPIGTLLANALVFFSTCICLCDERIRVIIIWDSFSTFLTILSKTWKSYPHIIITRILSSHMQMLVEKKTKAFTYKIYSHFTQQCLCLIIILFTFDQQLPSYFFFFKRRHDHYSLRSWPTPLIALI